MVLGIAVGSDDFIRRHAAATLEKAAKVEKKILEASLPDHDRFVMIAKCGVHARLVHTLRSTPPRLLDHVMREADVGTRTTLAKLIQAKVEEVPAWAFLPARLGGLGLATLESTAAPAFIAGTIASMEDRAVEGVVPPTAPASEQ